MLFAGKGGKTDAGFYSSDGPETGTGDLTLFLSGARPGAFIFHYPAGAIELSFDRFPSLTGSFLRRGLMLPLIC